MSSATPVQRPAVVTVRRGRVAGLAVAAASIVYGWLVPSSTRPRGWEHVVSSAVHTGGTSPVGGLTSRIIGAGSPVAVAAIAIGLAAGLAGSGRVRTAVTAFAAVVCGSAGAELMKHVIGRRIGVDRALAYPSGHTAGVAAAVMTMVLVVAPDAVPAMWRRLALVLPLAAAGVVGLAMVARGWHYPADVIGGLAFGICVPLALLGWPVAVPAAVAAVAEPADDDEPPLGIAARPPVSASRRFGLRGESTAPAPESSELAADTR